MTAVAGLEAGQWEGLDLRLHALVRTQNLATPISTRATILDFHNRCGPTLNSVQCMPQGYGIRRPNGLWPCGFMAKWP